jgi:hypothetical protein
MKILKGCALTFLSFILFLSLCVFGIAYTVNQVVLNPHYIVKILNDIDFSQIIQESINEQNSSGDLSPELQTALIDTFRKMEPTIKKQIGVVIEDTYAYLKGQHATPDFKSTSSKSVMNSAFVSELVNEIDISQLVNQIVKEQIRTNADFSDSFINDLIIVLDKSEPSLKKEIAKAAEPIFDYLLMQTSSIDLKSTFRQTVLSDNFVREALSYYDYTAVLKDMIASFMAGKLPLRIELTSQQLDRVAATLQPSVKSAFISESGNLVDYLLGTKPAFDVKVDVTPAFPTLKIVVKEAIITLLPGYLQGVTQEEIDNAYETYYPLFSNTLPTTYEISSNDLGTEAFSEISSYLNDAQNSLTEARNNIDKISLDIENALKEIKPYVGYFRLGYVCLIALIIVLILGIVLIYRKVKDFCLNLGIIFLIYGAGALAEVLITKYFVLEPFAKFLQTQLNTQQDLHNIAGILLNDALSPLRIVSLVCLIGGILLIATSLIYPRLKQPKII